MFGAFPKVLEHDVSCVMHLMSKTTHRNIKPGSTEYGHTYTLLDGQKITLPYRIYFLDECDVHSLSSEQRVVYHCIFSRSCDGFVREKHIRAILDEDYPDWVFPYILKASDEYIVEILDAIYDELTQRDNARIKEFCRLNMSSFLCSHDRMISYWNEFYRSRWFDYKTYIGRALFSECFGYTKSMEKERLRKIQ